jgi:hypothetical protein
MTDLTPNRGDTMLVFDLFSGTGSSTAAFLDAGHTIVSFELDPRFEATETRNILTLTTEYLVETYGRPDFVWASPPCTAFSVASIGHHWSNATNPPSPKTPEATFNQTLVTHTRELIAGLQPRYGYLIENPRGMLRKLAPMVGLDRVTVTYCQYGDTRQKPTDLWGEVLGWSPRPVCKPGSDCHVAAPRGSRTGTQGLGSAAERSRVPYELGKEILAAIDSIRLSEW